MPDAKPDDEPADEPDDAPHFGIEPADTYACEIYRPFVNRFHNDVARTSPPDVLPLN